GVLQRPMLHRMRYQPHARAPELVRDARAGHPTQRHGPAVMKTGLGQVTLRGELTLAHRIRLDLGQEGLDPGDALRPRGRGVQLIGAVLVRDQIDTGMLTPPDPLDALRGDPIRAIELPERHRGHPPGLDVLVELAPPLPAPLR